MSGGPWRRGVVALVVAMVAVAGTGGVQAPPADGAPVAVTVTRLATPDGKPLDGNDRINDAGEIAADWSARLPSNETEWYLWRDGRVTPIEPVQPLTQVSDLSARGQIVGTTTTPDVEDTRNIGVVWTARPS